MALFSKNAIFDKKKGACGKPPAEKNCLFPRERHFWQKKKAPAASRQLEEKSFGHFFAKKRRLRQAARRREMVFFLIKTYFFKKIKILIYLQLLIKYLKNRSASNLCWLEKLMWTPSRWFVIKSRWNCLWTEKH